VKQLGIIGCSEIISRVVIEPVKEIEAMTVFGIASRTREKAREYALRFAIPVAFDSYDSLLRSSDIDCVYIALANDLHCEWILKSLRAGKHVLVEKPLCNNIEEFGELKQAVDNSGLHLLEGLMVQHHPWQPTLKAIIASKKYGELKRINSRITFTARNNFAGNYRSFPERGGGSFRDVGCYWLQFIQAILGKEPKRYGGSSLFNGPNGSDWTFNAFMEFDNGLRAEFTSSFEMPYQASHRLKFEDAELTIADVFRSNLGNYKMAIQVDHKEGNQDKIVFAPQSYYTNQLKFFGDVMDNVKPNIPLADSYERIRLAQAILMSAQKSD
jgi:NDP-hexose-3-ketoreductase